MAYRLPQNKFKIKITKTQLCEEPSLLVDWFKGVRAIFALLI